MPPQRINVTNLSKGELTELVQGRTDLDQYYNGARTLENVIVLEQGAVTRRPGTRFVAEVKTSLLKTIIRRFVASKTDSFAIEMGEGYARFYKNSARIEIGGVPVEIATPYVAGDLDTLVFSQLNDVLFITSLFYQQRRIEHFSDTVWRLRTEPIDVPPSFEYGTRPGATLTPGAVSGLGVTFTASVAQFETSDVGREILVFTGPNVGGRATIVGFTSTTVVTADITQTFPSVSATAATDWKITESYKTSVTPSAKSPVGVDITLTTPVGAWRVGDVGKFIQLNGGIVEITSITSNLIVHGTIRSELNAVTAASSGAWTREESSWSAVNGFPACDEFRDQRHYYGGTIVQPQTGWGSKVADIDNFAVGVLADDAVEFPISNSQFNPIVWLRSIKHLIAGGTNGEFRVFGSQDQVITPTNVTVDPQTPNGSTDDVQPITVGSVILYVTASTRRLREEVFSYVIDGYQSTDILVLAQHLTRSFGITEVGYQREPTSLLWAPRDDGTMLTCTYIRDQNVIAWVRQITGTPVIDPDNDFHHSPSDGFFQSHCVIQHPNQDRDQVWIIAQRMINGNTKRYVEFFDDARFYYRQIHTDSAITYDGTGTAAITLSGVTGAGVSIATDSPFFVASDVGREVRLIGSPSRAVITSFLTASLVVGTITENFHSIGPFAAGTWGVARSDYLVPHLEGVTVDLVGDGAPQEPTKVVGGILTSPFKAIKMEIGIDFVSTVEPVRPEYNGPTGSVQGVPKSIPEVTLRLFETLGFSINDNAIEDFRIEGDISDQPPKARSGDYKIDSLLGVDTDGVITIQQKQPLPFTVTLINTVISSGV